jgi:hypothetical protein
MNKLLSIVLLTFLGFCVLAFIPNNNLDSTEEATRTGAALSGLWRDSNTTVYKNSSIIFSVEGSNMEMLHYMEWEGKPFVEKGRGKIYGSKLDYFVVVTNPIPGWAMTGEHFLTISSDGRTLRGAFEDENGILGSLVFKKVGK